MNESGQTIRVVQPICPHCGSTAIREWGSVSASYTVTSIEVTADGRVAYVSADEADDVAWDSYEQDSYMCRDCDATLTEAQMVEVVLAKPHVVMLDGQPAERFATAQEAEAYREALPEAVKRRTWIDTPEEEDE